MTLADPEGKGMGTPGSCFTVGRSEGGEERESEGKGRRREVR